MKKILNRNSARKFIDNNPAAVSAVLNTERKPFGSTVLIMPEDVFQIVIGD